VNKLIGIGLSLVLALGACTTPEEPPADDIAALDEAGEGTDAQQGSGGAKGKAGSKKDGGGAQKPGGKTNTSGGDGGTTTTPGGGGGSGNGDGGAQPGGGGGGSAPAAGAAVTPVPAGTLEYATQGERSVSGNESQMPETTTLAASAPADGVQRQTRDLRDSEGNGIVTDTDLLYREGSVYLTYVKITARFQGGLTDVREFRLPSPQLVAPAGGGPGYTRSFTMQGSGTRAKVSIRALRWQDVSAGGRTERALVVQNDIQFSGALEGSQRSTTWFWPKHLLPLREQVDTDVRNGPIRVQSNYVATIRRIP
jgi:hypothetical protein